MQDYNYHNVKLYNYIFQQILSIEEINTRDDYGKLIAIETIEE